MMQMPSLHTDMPADFEKNRRGLRSPDEVMGLVRMGASFPHRLSFMRSFIRRAAAQKLDVHMPVCVLDTQGFGHVVLRMVFCGHTYSLLAFSSPLSDEARTDRVIATRWDACFCLFDGVPDRDDIDRLRDEVTVQESGRYDARILILSRANKSVRLFQHVVDSLACGEQPDLGQLKQIGYLMRTTAVYGNGKFGIADRDHIARRSGLEGPFQAEMLCVYLIREFTLFLVEYCAQQKGGATAIGLDSSYRRYLGIGNSTGLGMAPFLVTHPILLHNWVMVRESALCKVRQMQHATQHHYKRFFDLLDRACIHCDEWQVEDESQMQNIVILRSELADIKNMLQAAPPSESYPFDDIFLRMQAFSCETQELIISLLIEIAPEEVDVLADDMATADEVYLDTSMSVETCADILSEHYRWVESVDISSKLADSLFWYTSQEKLEPRIGHRYEEAGSEQEMPFNIARYVHAVKADMQKADPTQTMATFLLAYPQHRYIIRRIQTTQLYPYAEIRGNLVDTKCRPIDLLRCKLSFFGASKFDPKSDKWIRITLYQGAPTAKELLSGDVSACDDWLFALSPKDRCV